MILNTNLQCGAGDKVWVVINRCHIEECVCDAIHITKAGIQYEINWSDENDKLEEFIFENDDFGKEVFLTKSEAENTLQEIFNEEDKWRKDCESNTLEGYTPILEITNEICWVIKRPIYGCSLNGIEYIHDKDGNIALFKTLSMAKKFLAEHGYDERRIEIEGLDIDRYIVTAKHIEFRNIIKFAHSNDYCNDILVRYQLRAMWAAYCLRWEQFPDTLTYDKEIADVFNAIVADGVFQYEAFDLFMGEFLC